MLSVYRSENTGQFQSDFRKRESEAQQNESKPPN